MARPRTQVTRVLVIALPVLLVLAVVTLGGSLFAPGYASQLAGGPSIGWRPGKPAAPAPQVLAALGADAPAPTPDGVSVALKPKLADAALGSHTVVSVADLATGQQLYDQESTAPTVPASTLKVLTAVSALKARGPTYRLETKAVAGAAPGEVVLVGGGDPTLGGGEKRTFADGARLDDLAAQVKKALGGTPPTKVVVDSSLFGAPYSGPGWDPDVEAPSPNAAPITALMIDGGRVSPANPHGPFNRVAEPDLVAGRSFAAALGVPAGAVSRGTAPAGANQLGAVQSPPMERLVELMLVESDNVIAESLARQVALAKNQPATFAGGATAMTGVLGELGLPVDGVVLADGSGLSRLNRVTPKLLTQALLLATKDDHPELRAVFPGLPVAGYSGTLQIRYRKAGSGAAVAGLVRAKTGSLGGISAVAGILVDADGRALAFSMIADKVLDNGATPTTASPSQEALDRVTTALAACGCH
jgi:D-alanyl-D-alanine carboxypeptidase/D-alanyl-D-alanine-endopeptidase (penicillin-binding protein 4)